MKVVSILFAIAGLIFSGITLADENNQVNRDNGDNDNQSQGASQGSDSTGDYDRDSRSSTYGKDGVNDDTGSNLTRDHR